MASEDTVLQAKDATRLLC